MLKVDFASLTASLCFWTVKVAFNIVPNPRCNLCRKDARAVAACVKQYKCPPFVLMIHFNGDGELSHVQSIENDIKS